MGTESGTEPGSFQIIQATRDGLPAVILFDAGLGRERQKSYYPWLITISIPILGPDEFGLPDETERLRLDNVEDALLHGLKAADYRYVGRVTWKAVRDVLLYVADPDEILKVFERQFDEVDAERITIRKRHDAGWDEYESFKVSARS